MRTEQRCLRAGGVWVGESPTLTTATLVMVFGAQISDPACRAAIVAAYPGAIIAGCSTAGNVLGQRVVDDLVVTAIAMERTPVRATIAAFDTAGELAAGAEIARALAAPDLAHVLVISEGVGINGTALATGLRTALPGVPITGGLAGDGERMQRTYVVLDDRVLERAVIGIGFYGDAIRVSSGCEGGWRAFGPERRITHSTGNVLHSLDGISPLALYRRYLGSHGDGLPATGLLFPMEIRAPNGKTSVVRTLLGIDEETGDIRFAGDMPEGHYARLMTASTTNLLEGASNAAEESHQRLGSSAALAIVISCVGRRMVLGQRTDDELGSVREVLGNIPMTGFYSYGELTPSGSGGCELHNQTMTLTTLQEVA